MRLLKRVFLHPGSAAGSFSDGQRRFHPKIDGCSGGRNSSTPIRSRSERMTATPSRFTKVSLPLSCCPGTPGKSTELSGSAESAAYP